MRRSISPRARLCCMASLLALLVTLTAGLGRHVGLAAGSTATPTPGAGGGSSTGSLTVPTTALSLATVEQQLLNVVSATQSAALSGTTQTALLGRLVRLSTQLQQAEGINHQLDNLNAGLDAMLQAKLDTTASLDKLSSDLQINLDQLQANVDANVNANVNASVGSLKLSVHASADTIKADLSAKASQLLVDITANLNVIKIITLDARAHVDAQRLTVTLHALVTKLTLDLNAVMKDLKVLAKANLKAALSAEAKLRVNITAQIDGLHTKLLANIDNRITLQVGQIAKLTGTLNALLSQVAGQLATLQQQL